MQDNTQDNMQDNEQDEVNRMHEYSPPYDINDEVLALVSSISEKVGRLEGYSAIESKPHLRRNNRIRSIHSSLKIEANSLSLSNVTDVINGRPVNGDRKEITEVLNAYSAYEKIPNTEPTDINALKDIHGIMTGGTVSEAGEFRTGEEGVFSGGRCIFIAPPPSMVPELMNSLFKWLKDSKDKVHPLIRGAVFHYEFVFIHPFSDGNGRMARLWHTIILYKWRKVFEYIPLESQIEKYQQAYYDAIAACNSEGKSNAFILFMLDMIDKVLDETLAQAGSAAQTVSPYIRRLLGVMEHGAGYTTRELLELLGLKSRETLRKNYISPALEAGLISMSLPDKPSSKNQRYILKL